MADQKKLQQFLQEEPTVVLSSQDAQARITAGQSRVQTKLAKAQSAEDKAALQAQQQQNRATARSQARRQRAVVGGIQAGASELADAASSAADNVTSWANSLPTPGGIMLLLFALLFLVWAIIPVNGSHTRLGLLWLTLTGQTSIPGSAGSGGGTLNQAVAVAQMTPTEAIAPDLPIMDFGE